MQMIRPNEQVAWVAASLSSFEGKLKKDLQRYEQQKCYTSKQGEPKVP